MAIDIVEKAYIKALSRAQIKTKVRVLIFENIFIAVSVEYFD